MPTPLAFEILHRDPEGHARLGRVRTVHGSFDTPAFMPVGTRGTIKGIACEQVAELGAQIILGNTYHLMLRPGSDLVREMGGLHRWIRWGGPILTDSGGFQVFSLSDINKISDAGVTFRSHLDGSTIELTPERSIQVQNDLGADIIMAFDDCPPALAGAQANGEGASVASPVSGGTGGTGGTGGGASGAGWARRQAMAPAAEPQRVVQACERSARWLEQCITAHQRPHDQALFGIIQGGTDLALRSWCVEQSCQHDLPGFAIGGVAVGEGYAGLKTVVEHTAPLLPVAKPRYLMGVGYERDILTAVRAGVDMFDCVLPTRNGRNANAFTPNGQIRLRNQQFARSPEVIDPSCDCPACRGGFSRSYLRHLFQAGEMLGPILVSMHNLRHFQRYLLDIRQAIAQNSWSWLLSRWPCAATTQEQR